MKGRGAHNNHRTLSVSIISQEIIRCPPHPPTLVDATWRGSHYYFHSWSCHLSSVLQAWLLHSFQHCRSILFLLSSLLAFSQQRTHTPAAQSTTPRHTLPLVQCRGSLSSLLRFSLDQVPSLKSLALVTGACEFSVGAAGSFSASQEVSRKGGWAHSPFSCA